MAKLSFENSGVAFVTLNNPPVNAIGDREIDELSGILDKLRQCAELRGVFFNSEGKHFSAGADLKMIDAWDAAPNRTDEMVLYSAKLQDLFYRIEQLEVPTIAVIRGTAAGAGLELALSCDLRFVEGSAQVGLPEVRFGWLASAGGTQRLTQRVGEAAALKMMLFDEFINAQEAFRVGLANWVADESELGKRVSSVSERLGNLPKAAVKAVKKLVRAQGANGFAQELYLTRVLEEEPESQVLYRNFLAGRNSDK